VKKKETTETWNVSKKISIWLFVAPRSATWTVPSALGKKGITSKWKLYPQCHLIRVARPPHQVNITARIRSHQAWKSGPVHGSPWGDLDYWFLWRRSHSLGIFWIFCWFYLLDLSLQDRILSLHLFSPFFNFISGCWVTGQWSYGSNRCAYVRWFILLHPRP